MYAVRYIRTGGEKSYIVVQLGAFYGFVWFCLFIWFVFSFKSKTEVLHS